MSSATEDLAVVVELACLTEDRSDAEQDALLRVAARVDAKRNALVVTNRRTGPASRLYALAESTRVLADDQRPRAKARVAERLDTQAQLWDAQRR